MQSDFSRLFSFALDTNFLARQVALTEDISQLFPRPLSPQAYQTFQQMEMTLVLLQIIADFERW
jgi:hypothetical protein